MRGQGLSDRGVPSGDTEVWARDLLAVIDAAGLERFALLAVGLVGAAAVGVPPGTPFGPLHGAPRRPARGQGRG